MSLSSKSIKGAIHLAVWASLLALFSTALSTRLFDPDLWWHLAAGREMFARHEILRADVFSHTLFGATWINFEWLSDIILFSLHRLGGPWLLLRAKVALGLAAILSVATACWAAGARRFFLAWLSVIAFLLLRPRLFERAELATLILFPLLISLVLAARGGTPFWRRGLPWITGALFILWGNLHAGFVYGWGALVALDAGARWSRRDRAFVRALDFSILTAIAGALINPFGVKIGVIFVAHLSHFSRAMPSIEEWAPAGVADAPVFWALFVACGALAGAGILRRRPAALFWAPAVLIFAVWGARAFRNTALFAPLALPFLAEVIAPALDNLRSRATRWAAAAAAWAMALAAAIPNATAALPEEPVLWRRFPVKACDFVRNAGVDGTLYNVYGFGGYIAWALGPERKVFMDGRYIFLPLLDEESAVLARLLREREPGVWTAYLDRYGADLAVMDYPNLTLPSGDSPYDLMFDRAAWALVFWDDAALVFARRKEKFARLIAEREYRLLAPYNVERTVARIRSGGPPAAEARRELERHRADVEFSFLRQTIHQLAERAPGAT